MEEDVVCLCCGTRIIYGNYCRECVNAMDEDVSLFVEVLSDGRYLPGKEIDRIEELDFYKHHNGRMRG